MNTLAAELIFDICDLLCPIHSSRKPIFVDGYFEGSESGSNNILALSSACRNLRRICWPRVFRSLRLHNPKRKISGLLSQPHLLLETRTIALRFVDKWGGAPSFFQGFDKLLVAATQLQTIAISIEMLMGDNPGLMTTLSPIFQLPPLNPELAHVMIRLRHLPPDMHPNTVFQFTSPWWTRIQTFQYKVEFYTLWLQVDELWANLSSLRCLNLGLPGQGPMSWSQLLKDALPALPQLEELVIADCRLKEDKVQHFLQNILPSCSRLTILTIDFFIEVTVNLSTVTTSVESHLFSIQRKWIEQICQSCPRMRMVGFGRVTAAPTEAKSFYQWGSAKAHPNTRSARWFIRPQPVGEAEIVLYKGKP